MNRVEAGLSANATDSSGAYVSQIEITDGALIVTFGVNASAMIAGQTVTLTPYEAPDRSIVWRCGYAAQPSGLSELGTADGGNAAAYVVPSVLPQYVPASCRP